MIGFQLLYNIFFVPLLWISFHIGGLVNKKIRVGIKGRKTLFDQLKSNSDKLNTSTRLWFHASSLGEFEQAKPIISLLKKKYPAINDRPATSTSANPQRASFFHRAIYFFFPGRRWVWSGSVWEIVRLPNVLSPIKSPSRPWLYTSGAKLTRNSLTRCQIIGITPISVILTLDKARPLSVARRPSIVYRSKVSNLDTR